MEIHLKIIGTLLILLSLTHAIFSRYFNWKNDLKPLSLINRQMMRVHTFFIALILFLMGLLCLTSANDLLNTRLGNRVLLGMLVFWLIRLVIQFFGYSTEHWKGKRFESWVHVLFSIFWLYMCAVFFIALSSYSPQ
jgi:hypothetical protein